ncbi:unnamed protein product, partial [Rotaria sp. Silwood1]
MSTARKRLSRLNQRLSHAYRRQSALHAIIDVFNYAGADVSIPISSASLSTTYNIPSPSSLSLPSTSPIEPIVLARKGYKLINSNDTFSKAAAVEYLQGLKGPCLLRNLKYFNIYNSFVCDTLHNLYLGATAKMLKLLLSKPSVTGGISYAMSVYGQIDNIAEIINSISFPSTTYRQPRDIRLFRKFKGNELRIILLAFENFLDEERYNHLKVLAFIAHIIEGQCLSKEAHKE